MSNNETDISTELPNFDARLRADIEAHIRKLKSFNRRIRKEEWSVIATAFQAYQQKVLDIDGYLNSGEYKRIQAATTTARKLYRQLIELTDRNIAWPLYEAVSFEEFDEIMPKIQKIAEFDLGTNPSEGSLKSINSDIKQQALCVLQKTLDEWYQSVSGDYPQMEEASRSKSHYSHFLECVFSALPPEIEPGISRAAVHSRRAYKGKTVRKFNAKLAAAKKAINKLSK